MRKILLLEFAVAIVLTAGVVSCSNEEFESVYLKGTSLQKAKTMNSVMTSEQVQAKLKALNEKYGCCYIIDEDIPAEEFNEFFFEVLENAMRTDVGLNPTGEGLQSGSYANYSIDDKAIDEIKVTSASRSLEDDDYLKPIKIYSGSNESFEGFNAKGYENFQSRFNIYSYSIKYNYTYGGRSAIEFDEFDNQTHYTIDNMPKDGINELLTPTELEIVAEEYDVTYVERSLNLTTIIYYDNNNPENTSMVSFGYTYKFEINGTTFKAIGTNNNSATAITIVED